VRLVAATDADLEAAAARGSFRAPLLHRLSGLVIQLPPLVQRRDDLGRLLLHFLRLELAALGCEDRLALPLPAAQPWLPAELVAAMALWSWPGNVRQLRNAARELAVRYHDVERIPAGPASERLRGLGAAGTRAADGGAAQAPTAVPATQVPAPRRRLDADLDEDELVAALRRHHWHVGRTAAALGIARSTLYDKIDSSTRIRKASQLMREEIEESLAFCHGDLTAAAARLEVSRRGLVLRLRRLADQPAR
jgi:two-component system nitrogen regulation response regulator GlnG